MPLLRCAAVNCTQRGRLPVFITAGAGRGGAGGALRSL